MTSTLLWKNPVEIEGHLGLYIGGLQFDYLDKASYHCLRLDHQLTGKQQKD